MQSLETLASYRLLAVITLMCIDWQLGHGERKGPGDLNRTGRKRGQLRTLG